MTATMLTGYAVTFSNMAVKVNDSMVGLAGRNMMADAMGQENYQQVKDISAMGSNTVLMMGLSNPRLYGTNNNNAGNIKENASYDNSAGGTDTELFLPDEFYDKNLPSQVTPGTKYLPKYDEVGNVKQLKMYDDYGREIGWVDYTNHGYGNANSPNYHTIPHWHEKIYNAQYPDGIKINHRTDINTPLGDK